MRKARDPILSLSPLRYPGGKQVLANVLAHLIRRNGLQGGTYAEPYAGGAGAALSLLFSEQVSRVMINDADARIHAFWQSALRDTDAFCKLIATVPLNVREWERQRAIYKDSAAHSTLKVGFATFYLNRCNRSGIIARGGPIGGKKQTGRWKIGARFNRSALAARILRIAAYGSRVRLSNDDALLFLRKLAVHANAQRTFVYLDPPYFVKGPDLYLNHYERADHATVAGTLMHQQPFRWVLTYDNVPQIRRLYSGLRRVRFSLDYSARERRTSSEMMILDPRLAFPPSWTRLIPRDCITATQRNLHAA